MPLDTDIPKDRARKRPAAFSDADIAHSIGDQLILQQVVNGLARGKPELSAKTLLWPWQAFVLGILALAMVVAIIVSPHGTATAAFGLLALPFLCVVILRLAALRQLAAASRNVEVSVVRDAELPSYAVLVPLFREAQTVPGLIEALARIDYPQHLLEISLIVEDIDDETRVALSRADLSAAMRIVVVPDGAPRTKPRALNYALATAKGEIVVVFDAEDAPEPDQLRRAAGVFRSERQREDCGPDKSSRPLACVQARLNIYNPHDSWLSRQFTLEYTALFDAILPALQHHDLPVPLGGTSNHFDRALLEKCGGWDPFNVTEDADLGIRFARFGARVEVLASTTWEEAPATFPTWIGQRTRWLKGWMQTYVVHMRQPAWLWRELGPWRFAGFQLLMGGMIASALVHPWFYLAIAVDLAGSPSDASSESAVRTGSLLFWVGLINLLAGYLSAMALGAQAVSKRGWAALGWHATLMPLYWLLISLAAHRALLQLITAPHLWEKTEHLKRTVSGSCPTR